MPAARKMAGRHWKARRNRHRTEEEPGPYGPPTKDKPLEILSSAQTVPKFNITHKVQPVSDCYTKVIGNEDKAEEPASPVRGRSLRDINRDDGGECSGTKSRDDACPEDERGRLCGTLKSSADHREERAYKGPVDAPDPVRYPPAKEPDFNSRS